MEVATYFPSRYTDGVVKYIFFFPVIIIILIENEQKNIIENVKSMIE